MGLTMGMPLSSLREYLLIAQWKMEVDIRSAGILRHVIRVHKGINVSLEEFYT